MFIADSYIYSYRQQNINVYNALEYNNCPMEQVLSARYPTILVALWINTHKCIYVWRCTRISLVYFFCCVAIKVIIIIGICAQYIFKAGVLI